MLQRLVKPLKIPVRNLTQGGGKGFLQTTRSRNRLKNVSEYAGCGDFYDLLGLSQSATPKRIKQAYYELAKKYHPDTNYNDAAADRKFKEITDAYKILSDDAKRREYDQREATSQLRRFVNDSDDLLKKAFKKVDVAYTDFAYSDISTIPEEIPLKLTVVESIEGGVREIFLPIKQNCEKCREKGLMPVNSIDAACSVCAGTGWQTLKSEAAEMKIPCKFCHGTKIAKRALCSNCDGLGYTIEQRKVAVSIPTMVEEGQLLKVKHPTRKRDLVFKLSIDQSPGDFIRRGFDLHSKVEISFTLAILGGGTMVRGLRHQLYVEVAPGTQTGQTIKLTGKGVRKFNSNKFGDHIVTIDVKLPERLTGQQKRLIEDFARTEEIVRKQLGAK